MSNMLESYSTSNPYGKTDECAKFTIDTTTSPFILNDIMTVGQEYTLSLWLKSDTNGSVRLLDTVFQSNDAWQKYTITFVAADSNLYFYFRDTGTYHIYRPQLEIGTIATDWTPSPEDTDAAVEALIELMNESIRMSITGPDGQSVMTQTENGWTFDITKVTDNTAREEISKLSDRVGGIEELNDYVVIGSYEGQPCIELGEKEKDLKLRITNTQIQFVDGSSVPAYMANQNGVSKLMIEKAEVKGELQIGDFVWQKRANGNVGLMWIGGNG